MALRYIVILVFHMASSRDMNNYSNGDLQITSTVHTENGFIYQVTI